MTEKLIADTQEYQAEGALMGKWDLICSTMAQTLSASRRTVASMG
jgi:hypothetical protein